jgi:hypothetical protein
MSPLAHVLLQDTHDLSNFRGDLLGDMRGDFPRWHEKMPQ